MRSCIAIVIAACQPAPAPVLANVASPAITRHVPFAPCPEGVFGPISHELFPACVPMPYDVPFSVCPHGECPRPCRLQLAGGGTQNIVYDVRGRMLSAQGNESRLVDKGCTYTGALVDECHFLYEGRATTTEKVWRDRTGRIIGTSQGEPMVGYDPHYTWVDGRIVSLDSTMGAAKYVYAGDRLVEIDRDDMGEKSQIVYTYDADGDVSGSSTDGVFHYDAKKRLVSAGKVKLAWDDRDRLIRSTDGDRTVTYTYECK